MGNSDFLFKMPGFVDGMARSIDLFGSFDDYNGSSTPEEADAKALYQDLSALKDDSDIVLNEIKEKVKTR